VVEQDAFFGDGVKVRRRYEFVQAAGFQLRVGARVLAPIVGKRHHDVRPIGLGATDRGQDKQKNEDGIRGRMGWLHGFDHWRTENNAKRFERFPYDNDPCLRHAMRELKIRQPFQRQRPQAETVSDVQDEMTSPKPLTAVARRVLGVLVEKAKTTPDNYPLTLASLISGCNQKSNRSPQMDVDDEDALLALDELKAAGAAREVQGSGRAVKYRHAAYDWFGIDGPGSAVITELLLRGPQTLGELRTRASRMHPFDDLSAVESVVQTLTEKNLIEAVTPPGRGQTFAHKLYPPQERLYLEARIEKQAAAAEVKSSTASPAKPSSSPVDALLARLETVNERIDSLEKRIAELES
jgi:hypothetical protein